MRPLRGPPFFLRGGARSWATPRPCWCWCAAGCSSRSRALHARCAMGLGPAWQGGGDHKLLATDAAASAHNTTSAAERRLPNRLCTYCVHDPSSGREALARCRSCMVCVCCGRNSPACAQLGALPVRPCMPWRIQLQPVTRLPGATRATAPCLASSSGPASLKRSLPLPPPPPPISRSCLAWAWLW